MGSVLDFPQAELADIVAVKAISQGEATSAQQTRAFDWIIKNLCVIGDLSFNLHEGNRASDFTEGKRFVANIMIWCCKTPIKKLYQLYPDQQRMMRVKDAE